MLAESPREDSGNHAKRRSDEAGDWDCVEDDEFGRSPRAGFC
jgi:hypothetical protein